MGVGENVRHFRARRPREVISGPSGGSRSVRRSGMIPHGSFLPKIKDAERPVFVSSCERFDRGHRLAGQPGEGGDLPFEGHRLGRVGTVLPGMRFP